MAISSKNISLGYDVFDRSGIENCCYSYSPQSVSDCLSTVAANSCTISDALERCNTAFSTLTTATKGDSISSSLDHLRDRVELLESQLRNFDLRKVVNKIKPLQLRNELETIAAWQTI